MKELIKRFITKLTCYHDWEQWEEINVISDWGRSYYVFHFKCKKCGKFKKIKSF